MSTLENVIVKCSKNPLAGLYDAAQKAADDPKRGVEIKNKPAYYVIRDCARTTLKWLPLELLVEFEDVKKTLSGGKLKKEQIIDFVKRSLSGKELHTTQILKFILSSLKFKLPEPEVTKQEIVAQKFEEEGVNLYNVYGEYSTMKEDVVVVAPVKEMPKEVKLDENEQTIVDFLLAELI